MISLRRMASVVVLAGLLGGAQQAYNYYQRCTQLPVNYPFITSNGFRHLAQYHYDQPHKLRIALTGESFDPATVKDGDIIFVKNGPFYLKRFFETIHPRIKARYLLLSQGADDAVPGVYEKYLADDNIIGWASCNVALPEHPKMIPIPIGVMGPLHKRFPANGAELLGRTLLDQRLGKYSKTGFLYNNIALQTNHAERGAAVRAFKDKPFCFNATPKPYGEYLREMATFKFVLSPHGTGYDCYRTWEALLLGCIPVVKSSCLDGLYKGLPVVIVNDWAEATQEFLERHYHAFKHQRFQLEKLTIDYWINVIRTHIEKQLSTY